MTGCATGVPESRGATGEARATPDSVESVLAAFGAPLLGRVRSEVGSFPVGKKGMKEGVAELTRGGADKLVASLLVIGSEIVGAKAWLSVVELCRADGAEGELVSGREAWRGFCGGTSWGSKVRSVSCLGSAHSVEWGRVGVGEKALRGFTSFSPGDTGVISLPTMPFVFPEVCKLGSLSGVGGGAIAVALGIVAVERPKECSMAPDLYRKMPTRATTAKGTAH